MTDKLKNEEGIQNNEKRLILLERQRLVTEKEEKQTELAKMSQQLKDEREQINSARIRLDNQQDEFLNEVEKRVKAKLEDWEQQSIKSMTSAARVLSNFDKDSLSNTKDQSVQTMKRMNDVTFNVDTGFEN